MLFYYSVAHSYGNSWTRSACDIKHIVQISIWVPLRQCYKSLSLILCLKHHEHIVVPVTICIWNINFIFSKCLFFIKPLFGCRRILDLNALRCEQYRDIPCFHDLDHWFDGTHCRSEQCKIPNSRLSSRLLLYMVTKNSDVYTMQIS